MNTFEQKADFGKDGSLILKTILIFETINILNLLQLYLSYAP